MKQNPVAPVVLDVVYDTEQRYVPEQPLYGKVITWGEKDPKTLREAIIKAGDRKLAVEFKPEGRFKRLRFQYQSLRVVSQVIKRLQKIRNRGYSITWNVLAKRAVVRKSRSAA